LGPDCPIFGGCAARQEALGRPIIQFYKNEIVQDAIPLLLFAGPVRHAFNIAHSWKPLGKPARVTQSEGCKIRKIDDLNAVDFYHHYLGLHSAPATAFPLAVFEKGRDVFYLRQPILYDSQEGSITFSEAIPEGSVVQITEGARGYIIKNTRKAVQSLAPLAPEFIPRFAVSFSCLLRKEALGTTVGEEFNILKSALPARTPMIGFYGFGEICPLAPRSGSFLHNASLLTLLIGEMSEGTAETAAADECVSQVAVSEDGDKDAIQLCGVEETKRQVEFLRKMLARSERYRQRLENVKELNASLYRKIVQEMDAAHCELRDKEHELRISEERYRRIVETAAEGFILLDENLRIKDTNEAYCKMMGYSREELLGKTIFEMASAGYREFLQANQEALLAQDYRKREGIFTTKDGRRIPVLVHENTLRDGDNAFLGHVAFITDLSEQVALQKELLVSEMRYRGMYENAVQGMFQVTLSGKLIRVNPAYARMLGYDSPHELQSQDSAVPLYDSPGDRERMIDAVKQKRVLTDYELKLRRKDGSSVWIMLNVRYLEGEGDEPILEGIAIDNTARKMAEDELRRSREMFRSLAIHDSLTGLYNTRHLYRALEDLLVESAVGELPFSLVFMDMDNFKRVVDTYGHLNGSQALKEVAATIQECLDEPAFGVAYGGDEFVVVLPGFDKTRARRKVEEIRARMKETVYLSSQGHAVGLSASFGIAAYPEDAQNLTGLLALADKAMFHVKEKGKDAIGTTT
ncbi:MAG: PAS domain S-box protein, partial [Desulforhabdus sp.]|nr:PAS domain S-box protein [Desulforhabdus sp.]